MTTIESLSYEGRGVSSIEGKTTFVFGALPDEQVEFTYTNRRNQFDEGQVTEVLQTNPQRVVPKCQHFGLCGGCSLQHLQHSEQVQHKQQVLAEHLQKIAGVQPDQWLTPITADPWGYRNKARLGVRYVEKKASVLVGFRERNSNFLANIDQCEVLNPKVGYLITPLRLMLAQLAAYRDIPQIEVAIGDEITALIFRHLVPLCDDDQQQLIAFAKQHNLHIYLQSAGPDSVAKLYPDDQVPLLHYRLPEFDLQFAFQPLDFTQINAPINRQMVSLAVDLLAPATDETVLDLFCGLGNFSLPLARKAKHVTGIEGDVAMTQRASQNAQANGISNTDFHVSNLFDDISEQAWAQQTYDNVLIDPPRSGAEAIVNQIERFAPKRIVYVSCNHATLARDSEILVQQKNYQLRQAGIIDMFPQTSHFENIAVFELATR